MVDKDLFARLLTQARDLGPVHEEVQLRRANGEIATGRVSLQAVMLQSRPAYFVVMGDLTDLRRTEARLRESERRYRILAENVHDVIWTLNLKTLRFSYISPSILELRGLTVEEALAEPIEASLTPESLARVQKSLGDIATGRSKGRDTGVYDQPCRDGSIKHVEISTNLVRDAAGAPIEVLGVSRDATERVRAQRAQEKLVADLRRALDEVKRLSGLIPICAHCKKVRDDAGFWEAVESYVTERTDARFSHGICPECLTRHYPGHE